MRRTLVTGGLGFIGANLTRRLLREGHEVHLLVAGRGSTWRLNGILNDVHLHCVDLREAHRVLQVVEAVQPEWIFHLAVHGAYSWQQDSRAILDTNVLGTANLVEACLKVGFESLVNTGSSSEYGAKTRPPAEDCWLEPNSCYAVSKASSTLYCRQVAQASRVHIPTLRLYSVYGPWEEPGRLMPVLLLHALERRYPPLASPGTARDYVYVGDVVEAYMLAATRGREVAGAVYNVGTGVQTTLRQLADIACQVFALRGEPRWDSMPGRRWDTQVWVADNRRIQQALGWQPRVAVEQGLRLFWEWFQCSDVEREFYRSHADSLRAA